MGQYYKIQITRKLNKPKEEEGVAIHEILFGAREDEKEPKYAAKIFDKGKGAYKTIVSESYGKRWEGDWINTSEFVALEQLLYNKRAVVNVVWDYSNGASVTWWDTFEEKNFYNLWETIKEKIKRYEKKRPRYLINYTYNLYVDMEEYWFLGDKEANGTYYHMVYHPIALLCNVWDTTVDEWYMGINGHNIWKRCNTVIWMSDEVPEGCREDTKESLFVENQNRKYEIVRTKYKYYMAIDTEGNIIKEFNNWDEINEWEMNYFNEVGK